MTQTDYLLNNIPVADILPRVFNVPNSIYDQIGRVSLDSTEQEFTDPGLSSSHHTRWRGDAEVIPEKSHYLERPALHRIQEDLLYEGL